MTTGPALLVDFGDLPSLVCLALETEPRRIELWHPRIDCPAATRLHAVTQIHRSAYDIAEFVQADSTATIDPGSLLSEMRLLLDAVIEARTRRCTRLIWPRQAGAGGDADLVRRLGEMAEMVHDLTCLAELDDPATAPVIACPAADLSDDQLADLADDTGAPLTAFWPCETPLECPCGRCRGCRRWQAAFATAGVPWPWIPAHVTT